MERSQVFDVNKAVLISKIPANNSVGASREASIDGKMRAVNHQAHEAGADAVQIYL